MGIYSQVNLYSVRFGIFMAKLAQAYISFGSSKVKIIKNREKMFFYPPLGACGIFFYSVYLKRCDF